MHTALLAALAVLALAPSSFLGAEKTQASTSPTYAAAGIVNAATNLPGNYAPNTIVSLYGTNLSYNVAGIAPGSTTMPRTLGGVTVYVGSEFANLFYVSPTQINLLIPNNLLPGKIAVTVVREGVAGPDITITLTETAPGLFPLNPSTAIVTHADGSLVTADAPAKAGEVVVVYAVGLGRTVPDALPGEIASRISPIQHWKDMQVWLNGVVMDQTLTLYAGLTPGCAGLYQINFLIPSGVPANPEIRVAINGQVSQGGLLLHTAQ